MKVSYNWITEYIETSYSVEQMSEVLTDVGLEVEKVEHICKKPMIDDNVVIGKILDCTLHPNADKLKVTKVNVGNEVLQIICGAPNVEIGQNIVVAKPGSILVTFHGEKIKINKAKIRGVESNGMLCSSQELGIDEAHDGILVLNGHYSAGTIFSKTFEIQDDYVFEIGLTPNRTDALGVIGIAREIAAHESFHFNKNIKLKWPQLPNFKFSNEKKHINVKINSNNCSRYCGVTLSNIKVETSPNWLQIKLKSVGLKPINNIVDVTNFVMYELGTPLHAFDLNKISHEIIVDESKPDDIFLTLDKVQRKLNGSELMINDGKIPLCIAGIMGGSDSGIKDNTTSIFIESAIFEPSSIRKTAKLHGINSDSSFRFERGVDPDLTLFALKRAVGIILEMQNAQLSMDFLDISNKNSADKYTKINLNTVNKLIGFSIELDQIERILELLDFKVTDKNKDTWTLKIPNYRHDVFRECDVIEEILRIYGYNRIPIPDKISYSIGQVVDFNEMKLISNISNILRSNGFYEVMNNSLCKISIPSSNYKAIQLLNPLSNDLAYLRTSLKQGIIQNIAFNLNRQSLNLKFFEFGKIYYKIDNQYNEIEQLGIAITGNKENESWDNSNLNSTIFTLKGILEMILDAVGITNKMISQNQLNENTIEYVINNSTIVCLESLSKEHLKTEGIKQEVFFASIDLKFLKSAYLKNIVKNQEIPKTFSVRRDLALLINESVKYSELKKIIEDLKIENLKTVNLFDVYEGEKIEKGKKSYAISFLFQDQLNTLTDSTVDKLMHKITSQIIQEIGAELR